MKYIVVALDPPKEGQRIELPIIFPDDLTHREVGHWMTRAVEHEYREHATVVSAGFISHHNGTANGHSESLGLSSRPEDQALIDKYVPRAPRLGTT